MTKTTKAPLRAVTFTTDEQGREIVRVPLASGQVATVDRDDFERLVAAGVSTSWTFNPTGNGGPAYVRVWGADTLLIVARLIVGAGPREQVRYRREDRLDLRRSNLRVCSEPRRRKPGPRKAVAA